VRVVFIAPYQLWSRDRADRGGTAIEATSRARRAEQIGHDRKFASQFRKIFPETSKDSLVRDLLNQHIRIQKARHFLTLGFF
jgi:hypothetical protein